MENVKTPEKAKVEKRKAPDLFSLALKNLESQMRGAGITAADLEKLQAAAEKIKEKEKRIEELKKEIGELENQIQALREPVEPIAGALRDADGLRLALVGLGLLNEEALKIIVGPIYQGDKKNTGRRGGKGRKVVFQGKVYKSAASLVDELAAQGKLKKPQSSFSAVRLLKRWAKRNGYKVTETETELIIE